MQANETWLREFLGDKFPVCDWATIIQLCQLCQGVPNGSKLQKSGDIFCV
jgi:hypothetical protein